MAQKTVQLSCFGLKLEIGGEPVRVSGADNKYFRNMCIEFLGRHFPDALWHFFPKIRGPWLWGTCADKDGLKKFFAENCALRMKENGDIEIFITTEVSEIVFTPDRKKRMYAQEIDIKAKKSAYGIKLPYPIEMTDAEYSKFRNACLDFINECEPERFAASFDNISKSSKYGKVIDKDFQKTNAQNYHLTYSDDEDIYINENSTDKNTLVHSIKP